MCLADFCEIFRCDVVSGVARATFWDVALCMEEDMKDLTQDCTVRIGLPDKSEKLRNKFDFRNVHGIMNTLGLLQS